MNLRFGLTMGFWSDAPTRAANRSFTVRVIDGCQQDIGRESESTAALQHEQRLFEKSCARELAGDLD